MWFSPSDEMTYGTSKKLPEDLGNCLTCFARVLMNTLLVIGGSLFIYSLCLLSLSYIDYLGAKASFFSSRSLVESLFVMRVLYEFDIFMLAF
jgi:hypothetical protein